MGEIYCLYATDDEMPRYVGQTDGASPRRFKQHVTAALEKAEGNVYDWIREVWRDGHEIEHFVLQTDIIPGDLDFYEKYWMTQFSDLLNIRGNVDSPSTQTEVGQRVIEEIRRSGQKG